MGQKRDRRLIPHFSRSRFFAIVGTGRSPLLCGALPPAKRHGSESRHHFCVAYRRARHHLARVPCLTQSAPMAPSKWFAAHAWTPALINTPWYFTRHTRHMSLSVPDKHWYIGYNMPGPSVPLKSCVRHTRDERQHESQTGRACRAPPTRRSCWTSPA